MLRNRPDRSSLGPGSARQIRILALVFFLSGSASLIYQVAWQRLLTVYYGVGATAITLIVSVYMLGLGLGALAGGAFADRVRRRVATYVVIELLLCGFGALSPFYLDFLGRQTAGSDYRVAFVVLFAFLAVPTLLMGMTLPLVVRIFNDLSRDFLDSIARLYCLNAAGAALGAVLASYVLISFFGLAAATRVAASINAVCALGILAWGRGVPSRVAATAPDDPPTGSSIGRVAYPLVFVTGFLAIGYEITWFRIVGVLVKASPYAFSTVLFVYLCGIALGSAGLGRLLRSRPAIDGRSLFFLLQFLIGLCVLGSTTGYAYLVTRTRLGNLSRASFLVDLHPSGATGPGLASFLVQFDILLWPLLFVFVPALLMGAGFPLLNHLARSRRGREGRIVGSVYFFNTLGNLVGGALTGLVILPAVGTERTLLFFAVVGVTMGLGVARFPRRAVGGRSRAACVAAVLVASAIWFPGPEELYRTMHVSPGPTYAVHVEEGIEGVVVAYEDGERVVNYINGLRHGGRPGPMFHRESLEALSYARSVENVLVVGFGTGSVVETVLAAPGVDRVTVVELNGSLMRNLEGMGFYRKMLADHEDRLDVVIEDGRRFLLRSSRDYDLILIDPLRSTTSYSNNLYSVQFFRLASVRLAPGGVFMLWMDEHRVLPKTLASAFEHVRIYNFFSLASSESFRFDPVRWEATLRSFPAPLQRDIESVETVFMGSRPYVERVAGSYPINEDWRPVCEYYLGLGARAGRSSR